MQTYIVNEDYLNLGFCEKINKLCRDFRIEIDYIDMLQFNNLVLKSNKDYPFDGLESKEIWDLNMQIGLRLKQIEALDLADKEFITRMFSIMRKLTTFSAVADGAKLKILNERNKINDNI
jgi:hypothetical protein